MIELSGQKPFLTLGLVLACGALWLLAGRLVALGAGQRLNAPLALLAGAALIAVLLVASAPLLALAGVGPFAASLLGLGLVGGATLATAHKGWPLTEGWLLVPFVLVFPILWGIATLPVLQWDDLSHYALNARDMFQHNQLPNATLRYPEFPLAATLLALLPSQMANTWLYGAVPLTHALLMALSGMLVARAAWRGRLNTLSLAMIGGAGVLLAWFLNPFMLEKTMLSGHPDFPLAVALLLMLHPLLKPEALPQGRALLIPALGAAFAVATKEVGLYLVLMGATLWAACAWREGRGGWWQGPIVLLATSLPLWGIWQGWVAWNGFTKLYQATNIMQAHTEWLPDVLLSMLGDFWARPHAAAVLGVLGLLAWRQRQTPYAHRALVPWVLWVGYSALLALAFITSFPETMARPAQGYWRFLSHIHWLWLGLLMPLVWWGLEKRGWLQNPLKGVIVVSALLVVGQAVYWPLWVRGYKPAWEEALGRAAQVPAHIPLTVDIPDGHLQEALRYARWPALTQPASASVSPKGWLLTPVGLYMVRLDESPTTPTPLQGQ